jgi:hypothetical protein
MPAPRSRPAQSGQEHSAPKTARDSWSLVSVPRAIFNRTGMPVGRRASQTYWNTYCGQLASAVKLVGQTAIG